MINREEPVARDAMHAHGRGIVGVDSTHGANVPVKMRSRELFGTPPHCIAQILLDAIVNLKYHTRDDANRHCHLKLRTVGRTD